MPRINKRNLKMKLGTQEYNLELSDCRITSEKADSDFVTFADANGGGLRQYYLEGVAAQDTTTGSIWDKIMSVPGTTVAGVLSPFGNATPTVTNPAFSFNATIKEPDDTLIGGEADDSTSAVQTIVVKWPLDAKPTKVTA